MIGVAARERIVVVARGLVGLPYVWGANTPEAGGLDCSGFAQWCLHVAGVDPWASQFPAKLDMTAQVLWKSCAPVDVGEHTLPGDLAFYGAADVASHVVVVSGIAGVPGAVAGVIGASKGDAGCKTPADAMQRGARIKVFPTHLYRKDCLGFRRPYLRA